MGTVPTSLGEMELRVLGVLIEKSLSQAGTYPLTMNSITLGVNQKQNRDPVSDFSERQVAEALGVLIDKDVVCQAPPEPNARANRFAHRVLDVYMWDRREQAILAELILRGLQTAGELRTRASRMVAIPDVQAAIAILKGLRESDPPYVEELPREPGRSTNRFRHLLGTRPEESGSTLTGPSHAIEQPGEETGGALVERVETLEARVAYLTEVVENLAKSGHYAVDDAASAPI